MDFEEVCRLHSERFSGLLLDCGVAADPGVNETEEWRDWTQRKTTRDQLRIENYLAGFDLAGRRILHIGVGNSGLAQRFASSAKEIFGTTVIEAEAERGNSLGIPNYRVIVHNKYSDEIAAAPAGFDFIVDNNPTSFCCCFRHLAALVEFYSSHLAQQGQVVSDRGGLAWAISANPGWGFSLQDFAEVTALGRLSCYRINSDTFVVAREEPQKPPIYWRTMIRVRSFGRRALGRARRYPKSLGPTN